MKIKKISVLILLISLSFFYISCSTNNYKIEGFNDSKSTDHIGLKKSKVILVKNNLDFTFNLESIDNIEPKQSKIILEKNNLNFAFNTKSIDNIGSK